MSNLIKSTAVPRINNSIVNGTNGNKNNANQNNFKIGSKHLISHISFHHNTNTNDNNHQKQMNINTETNENKDETNKTNHVIKESFSPENRKFNCDNNNKRDYEMSKNDVLTQVPSWQHKKSTVKKTSTRNLQQNSFANLNTNPNGIVNPFDSINPFNDNNINDSNNNIIDSLIYSHPIIQSNSNNMSRNTSNYNMSYWCRTNSWKTNMNHFKNNLRRTKFEIDHNNIIYQKRPWKASWNCGVIWNNDTTKKMVLNQSISNDDCSNRMLSNNDIKICLDNSNNVNLKQTDNLKRTILNTGNNGEEYREDWLDNIEKINSLVINPYDFLDLNLKAHLYCKNSTLPPSNAVEVPKYRIAKKKIQWLNNNPFLLMPKRNSLNIPNLLKIPRPSIDAMEQKWENDFYSAIAVISEFQEITENIHSHENNQLISIVQNNKNDKFYTRKINIFTDNLSSSLLKSIAFALTEKFIWNRNWSQLTVLLYYMVIYGEQSAKKEWIVTIKNIWIHWDCQQWEDAYIVFLNVSTTSKAFFISLTTAIKRWIFDFIEVNKHLLPSDYYDLTEYNSDVEDNILLLIIPHVFETNVTVFTPEEKEYTFSWHNKTIINESNSIYLCYRNYSYSVYYKTSWYSYYKNYASFTNAIDQENNQYNYITIEASESTCKCDNCNNITDRIVFTDINNNEICKQCWSGNIKQTLKEMFKHYKQHNYEFLEEYVNFFKIHDSPIWLLSDKLLNELTSITSVSSYFQDELLNEACCCCSKIFNFNENSNEKGYDNKAYAFKCGCIYCISCVKAIISKSSDTKIVWNDYEKWRKNVEYVCVVCSFVDKSLGENIKFFYNEAELNEGAKQRLIQTMKNVCCVCDNSSNNNKIYRFVIREKLIEHEHCICMKCKKKMESKMEQNDKQDSIIDFECVFCMKKHTYVPEEIDAEYQERSIGKIKDSDNKCCCII